jgi:(2R)-sulfolactate sulfo-lyase subunit alpha
MAAKSRIKSGDQVIVTTGKDRGTVGRVAKVMPDDHKVVVEGVKSGMAMTGWIMDEDRMIDVQARQDIPIGHKVALKDMAVGDTVWKYGIDMGKVVAPIQVGQHAHVHNIKTKPSVSPHPKSPKNRIFT